MRVRPPKVSYRETLRKAIQVDGICDKSMAKQFAKVTVAFEPFHGDQPIVVVNRIPPESLPKELSDAAERGIKGALQSGEQGYPVLNVKATLLAAQIDQELSSDIAFENAGYDAVHRAMRDNFSILWPIMKMEVTVPEEYLGPVTSDLKARRADIDEMIARGKLRVLKTRVPLARVFDYSEKVRSLTQGRASWTMEPDRYEEASDDVVRKLLNPDGQW